MSELKPVFDNIRQRLGLGLPDYNACEVGDTVALGAFDTPAIAVEALLTKPDGRFVAALFERQAQVWKRVK